LKLRVFSALATAILIANPAAAQDHPVALKGARLLTITHGAIENGVVVMQSGKITAVGAANAVNIPSNSQIVDVTGMTVYPGLIDSETHLGLTEISAEAMTNDMIEMSDEIMPHMHVADAFHAESALIPVARLNGITNAVVAPEGGDTLPGQDSFIQLAGASAPEMLLIRDSAMPLNFTGDQRRNKGGFEKRKFPSTRMGLAAQLRQAFLDARDYRLLLADNHSLSTYSRFYESIRRNVSMTHILRNERSETLFDRRSCKIHILVSLGHTQSLPPLSPRDDPEIDIPITRLPMMGRKSMSGSILTR
jgi:hypothetical protein